MRVGRGVTDRKAGSYMACNAAVTVKSIGFWVVRLMIWMVRIMVIAGGSATGLSAQANAQRIDLPASKETIRPVPGGPWRFDRLPITIAVSPDGGCVVTVNEGCGTYEPQYWDDTALFIAEDDAQNGADQVDGHRSLASVVSKYAPK
jgi:hypothetical protein